MEVALAAVRLFETASSEHFERWVEWLVSDLREAWSLAAPRFFAPRSLGDLFTPAGGYLPDFEAVREVLRRSLQRGGVRHGFGLDLGTLGYWQLTLTMTRVPHAQLHASPGDRQREDLAAWVERFDALLDRALFDHVMQPAWGFCRGAPESFYLVAKICDAGPLKRAFLSTPSTGTPSLLHELRPAAADVLRAGFGPRLACRDRVAWHTLLTQADALLLREWGEAGFAARLQPLDIDLADWLAAGRRRRWLDWLGG